MIVSICCLTYNQVGFIKQTLEGFISQKTQFQFEIIIHDDCSTDGTTEILREYQNQYPKLIKVIFQTDNLYSQGIQIAPIAYKQAQGKYIAVCEGDDYWTDPLKLQKQVDFLEANPEYSMCFHIADTLKNGIISKGPLPPHKSRFTLEDLLERNFIRTLTVMFRQEIVNDLPTWYYLLPLGDWPLGILNAMRGPIGFIPETMAVYRVHEGGVWTSANIIKRAQVTLDLFEILLQNLDSRYAYKIRQGISKSCLELANAYADQGQQTEAKQNILRSIREAPINRFWFDQATLFARLFLPPVHRFFKRMIQR